VETVRHQDKNWRRKGNKGLNRDDPGHRWDEATLPAVVSRSGSRPSQMTYPAFPTVAVRESLFVAHAQISNAFC